MNPRAFVYSVALLGSAVPQSAIAQDVCTQIFVYAVKQFCSLLPNGQSLCQPIALTGPSPACEVPANAKFTPVPLAPPSLQFPQFPQFAQFPPVPQYQPMQPGVPFAYPNAPIMPNPYMPRAVPNLAPNFAPPYPPLQPFGAPYPFGAPLPFSALPAHTFPGWIPPAMLVPQQPGVATFQPALVQAPAVKQPEVVVAPIAPPPAQTPTPVIAETPAVSSAVPAAAETPVIEPVAALAAAPVAEAQVTPAPGMMPAADTATSTIPEPVPQSETVSVPQAIASTPSVVVEDALAHFAFDSAELTEVGRSVLDDWLAKSPVGMPIVVTGYADRLGPEPYNLKLSARRAESVREYLISKGKDKRDIRTIAKGEADPVKRCRGAASLATKDCLAPNRRVEIDPE